jgi:hypothetical protein
MRNTTWQTIDTILQAATALAGPTGALIGAIRGLVAVWRDHGEPPDILDEAMAVQVLRDLLVRNAATLAVCDRVTAKNLAFEAYLRARGERIPGGGQ